VIAARHFHKVFNKIVENWRGCKLFFRFEEQLLFREIPDEPI